MQFTVGLKLKGKTDRIAVDAEDALIAALRVKTERPEAVITYVRQQNRRGDARHPSHGLSEDKHRGTIPPGDQVQRRSTPLPDRPGPRAQFERRRDEFLPRDLMLLHAAGRYTM